MVCEICGKRTRAALRVEDKVVCRTCRGSHSPSDSVVAKVTHSLKLVTRKACEECGEGLRSAQIHALRKAEAVLCGGCRRARLARRRLNARGHIG